MTVINIKKSIRAIKTQPVFTFSSNRNTRTRSEICSKLTINPYSGVFIVNFEHISHLVLVFLLLILNAGWI